MRYFVLPPTMLFNKINKTNKIHFKLVYKANISTTYREYKKIYLVKLIFKYGDEQ